MSKRFRVLRRLVAAVVALCLLGALAVGILLYAVDRELPAVEEIREVKLQVPLRIFAADGTLMAVYGEKRRVPVTIDEVPEAMRLAFIGAEDANFYRHPGIDIGGIARAVWHVIRTGGDKGPGGSTITQQLTRNFFVDSVGFEVTYERKLKEILLALKVERELSKAQIIELYLNKIYLGNRAYGVGAAARVYYGKTLDELTLAETAMIASLPKAPSRINPINNLERSLERRNYTLGRMRELGYITEDEYRTAVAERDRAYPHGPTVEVDAPYAAELVRQQVMTMLGSDAYTGGYRVYTTFNADMQTAANRAVDAALRDYDERHGYRGPEARLELSDESTPEEWIEHLAGYGPIKDRLPGLVVEVDEEQALVYLDDGQTISLPLAAVAWAKPYQSVDRVGDEPTIVGDVLAVGDLIRVTRDAETGWRLAQIPDVEGALVSLDSRTGAVLALVGGWEFARSKFNRAIQGRRQPGSSFKPVIYSAALEKGMTPATVVNDAPIVFDDPSLERKWRPENYSRRFYGPTRLREGIVNSRNLVSIRVLRQIGAGFGRDYATRFGFERTELPADLSLALGSAAVPPLSMARAYAVFSNGGFLIEPYFVERVTDQAGEVLFQAVRTVACEGCLEDRINVELAATEETAESLLRELTADEMQAPTEREAPRVITEANAFLITDILRDVVRRGTGRRALTLERPDVAGKTGTTNEQRDAWFSGFAGGITTTAWVGFDQTSPLGEGEIGGRAALPMWIEYMQTALADRPFASHEAPPGVTRARIDAKSGRLVRAAGGDSILEFFLAGRLPDEEPDGSDFANPESPEGEDRPDPFDIF